MNAAHPIAGTSPPLLSILWPFVWFVLFGTVFLVGSVTDRAPVLVEAPSALATTAAPVADAPPVPTPEREFRGVWVATVANIDWPSQQGLSTDAQQAELVALLDRAVALNLNTVIFQVRPAADALYASSLEPWSEYLTGEMGKAPEPFYDPLAFAVAEAHRRGLELHAWFNPYRARHATGRSRPAPLHISRQYPEAVKTYGRYQWLDPGAAGAEDYTLAVILDVVRRYDIDGVHLDDYFYPYKEQDEAGRDLSFPDDESWQRARQAGETRSRDDWRRHNVDRLIERLYGQIKRTKPWVKFGVSPFGIWRPGHPAQIKGFDAYAELYADARKWLANGWVDYLSPQLYWEIDAPAQSYPVLLQWWDEQNRAGRHLWPGNFTSRIGGEKQWHPREIVDQIRLTRAQPGATGNVHFSMKVFMENREAIGDHLKADVYAAPALVPASPWLGATPPGPPRVELRHDADGAVVAITPAERQAVWLWIVRARHGDAWTLDVTPGWKDTHPVPGARPDEVAVSAVDRLGNEGPVTHAR